MSETESNSNTSQLRKELGLFDVFALATGATLSAGLFLLPGPAFAMAGPAIILCYLLAAIPLIPAMLCIVELSTAMPKAGGAYYFLERSLGPLVGTVGGLGTWLALVLKTSFALIGLGAYVALYVEPGPWVMKLVAVAFAIIFCFLNVLGAKKTSGMQRVLVIGLLTVLLFFVLVGLPAVETAHMANFFGAGNEAILATAGMVYISYVGVTKVASVAEEVADPERNLPKAVFLSLAASLAVYVLCTTVLVGILPSEELAQSVTPMADAAKAVAGNLGQGIVSMAAILAFFSVCNAGILASSRYPMAMSRDGLAPPALSELSKNGVPLKSILLTTAIIIVIVVCLDPLKVAKLASAYQLLMFAFLCGAVIVMRESGLASYDPGYKAPFYPWLPLFGTMAPFLLIFQMGWLPTLFSAGLVAAGVGWYTFYGKRRVERRGAIFHVFARLGEARHEELDTELRSILKEKGLRDHDPFEEIVIDSVVLDLEDVDEFTEVIDSVSLALASRLDQPKETFVSGFTEGTMMGATPVAKGVALPHMRLPAIEHPRLVLVRLRKELRIMAGNVFGEKSLSEGVHAAFFLISPEEDPGHHLRVLAQLASRIDQSDFMEKWLEASNELQLREVFLRDDRHISVHIEQHSEAWTWAGKSLASINLPDRCLVAAIRRGHETLVPRGSTRLLAGDRLLLFGEPDVIAELYEEYVAR
jgi:basic amino acid/polyamine antiporter, APA family